MRTALIKISGMLVITGIGAILLGRLRPEPITGVTPAEAQRGMREAKQIEDGAGGAGTILPPMIHPSSLPTTEP